MRKTKHKPSVPIIWYLIFFTALFYFFFSISGCTSKKPDRGEYARRYFEMEESYDNLRNYYDDTSNLKRLLLIRRGTAFIRDTIIFPKNCAIHAWESSGNRVIIQYIDTSKFD